MIPGTVQRIAHRGGANLAPENTLAAFRNAFTLPIDTIEFDVQMSRDGHLIVFHDNVVDRLTNGTGNVLDLDFSYLRSLNAAAHFAGGWPSPERIPTLREALALFHRPFSAQIEIKLSQREGVYGRYPGIVEAVVEEIYSASLLDQVLVISFDQEAVAKVKMLAPTIQTGVIVSKIWWGMYHENPLQRICEHALAIGCSWIGMDYHLFSLDAPDIVHQYGLRLGVWTVNSVEDLRAFSQNGVDTITSDRPDLFAQ